MRTRSIWGGVLIHVGVAMTMDVLALRRLPPVGSGQLPQPLAPIAPWDWARCFR